MAKKKVYAVKVGRQTGLFNTWAECEAQVKGFMGAKFKGFMTAQEAMAWLAGAETPATVPLGEQFLFSPGAAPARKKPATAVKEAPAFVGEADYIIYTDGSCLRNPDGPGGWAAVLTNQATGHVQELFGGDHSTTNNRMELTAAIKALSAVPAGSKIALYTDSQYMKNGFTKHWLEGWKKKGWITSKGTPVLNKELWLALDEAFHARQVEFHWVKGHVGVEANERCDQLAKAEAMKYM
ncbi:MAG: ribonuclease HI [Selenomonas sp.]|nr:ribonuclease HI [Selenomonas sp.]